jgi:hypothetical protein
MIFFHNFPKAILALNSTWKTKWCGEGVDEKEFFRFAKEFDGLSFREAHAIYAKHDFWTVRLGIVHYADERSDNLHCGNCELIQIVQ